MLYIHYMIHFPCSTWVQKKFPGMPINLAIMTFRVVADLVKNKELEGIFSGTITRHNVVLFFPLMHFELYFDHRGILYHGYGYMMRKKTSLPLL